MMIYEENDTMRTIGKTSFKRMDKIRRPLMDVIRAYENHPECGLIQLATDLVILGIMIGKGI